MAVKHPTPQIGDRFGRWTVIETTVLSLGLKVRVRCDCGHEASRPAHVVLNGKSTQCSSCAEQARMAPLPVALRHLKKLDAAELHQLQQAITTALAANAKTNNFENNN